MYYLRRIRPEWVLAILVLLLVATLLTRGGAVEGAEGFYIVRPTYWKAIPTEFRLELTSFYPTNLVCDVNILDKTFTILLEPRGSATFTVKGSFTPNTILTVPISLDCGVVKEKGIVRAFVFTGIEEGP